jgi:CHAT domain-containing protein
MLGFLCALAIAGPLSLRGSASDPANPGWIERGRQFYDRGQFQQAVEVWQEAARSNADRRDPTPVAIALSNLGTTWRQLGEWKRAEMAIARSLSLVNSGEIPPEARTRVLAQALNARGHLEFDRGQLERAADTWEAAIVAYREAGDRLAADRVEISLAQALQGLGFYRRSRDRLEALHHRLSNEPDLALRSESLRALGNALRLVGDLERSRQVLQSSLSLARQLSGAQRRDRIGQILLDLGNTARAEDDLTTALQAYRDAAATSDRVAVEADLNALAIAIRLLEGGDAQAPAIVTETIDRLPAQLDRLHPGRSQVYAQINFAQSLSELAASERQFSFGDPTGTPLPQEAIARLFADAVRTAEQLQDKRALSHALGSLGHLYEQNGQIADARQLTERALLLAQQIDAADIAYRWQWQLGRLAIADDDRERAIVTYSEAVKSLQAIRYDLVTVNREVQFSFRDRVEPVYRELLGILLQGQGDRQPTQDRLRQALKIVEALQLAELDNFFRDACLDTQPVEIDRVDPHASIFYPLILDDRLHTIVSLPGQPLRHFSHAVPKSEVEQTLIQLRQSLVKRSSFNYLQYGNQVYQWLIEPIAAELAAADVQTLVFVPDGLFRNIPMSTLYDGEQFLIENYAIALTPGLQILKPNPLKQSNLKALTAGISEARSGFSALPYVKTEIREIHQTLPGLLLLNENFTRSQLRESLLNTPFEIVHIATHGQFSSQAEDTFILAWDERINVNEFDNLLRVRERTSSSDEAIELLVLSACETASGDSRAALGLAGIAIKAGARSTLATLWYIDDAATAPLMVEFYRQLNRSSLTKAEALRQAQINLLKIPEYQHPIYWGPYVLVGNWL